MNRESHPSPAQARRRAVAALALGLAAVLAAPLAGAQRSGKQVVDATCAGCHASGAQGAPKIGDRRAWAPLASRGLSSLTENALKGVRKMPAHGGNPGLTDIEIERAITYMVNRSGGRWAEPLSGATPAVERRGEEIVKAQCAKCHASGAGGAPRIGERDAWIPRLKQGLDFLVRSAIHGHGPMPPRGGMVDLTDAEIRGAIIYMINAGTAAPKQGAAPPSAHRSNVKVVEGTEIFLGIVAAETLRAQHPKPDAESGMHGGIPSGRGYYHVNVSLFDAGTRAAIGGARVEARVASPLGGETKILQPFAVDRATSYGNYFRMPGKDPYTITVTVRRPGAAQPIEAKFPFRRN